MDHSWKDKEGEFIDSAEGIGDKLSQEKKYVEEALASFKAFKEKSEKEKDNNLIDKKGLN